MTHDLSSLPESSPPHRAFPMAKPRLRRWGGEHGLTAVAGVLVGSPACGAGVRGSGAGKEGMTAFFTS